ncbi:MAG: hypothetical protein WC707_01250 [Candidatus Babeliaceae bacterium]|jgi:hypothetical protein
MVKNGFLGMLVQAWRESLGLLAPKNSLKLLALTLKTYTQMWRALITGAWWFLLPSIIVFPAGFPFVFFGVHRSFPYIAFIFYTLFQFFLLCAMRPSVDLKNSYYFWHKLVQYFFYFLTYLLISSSIYVGIQYLLGLHSNRELMAHVIVLYLLAPWYIVGLIMLGVLIGLFLLDSGGRFDKIITAWWRALKMIVYNAPIFIVLIAMILFISYGYVQGASFINGHVQDWLTIAVVSSALYLLFIAPFFMCLLTNLYTMWIHQQFKLYYDEK